MKNTTMILASLLLVSAVSFSFIKKPVEAKLAKENPISVVNTKAATITHDHALEVTNVSNNLNTKLQLTTKGLSMSALGVAVKGYMNLKEQGALKNENILSIVDFSQSSRKKRFYLIDIKNNELLVNTYVAHGKNSGVDMANDFSNTIGSEKSSVGFYVTKGTYTGKNGFSLKLSGLDKGFNNNAEARAIVVHGADYVNAGRANSAYMGRSQGCPALPRAEYIKVIDLIKDGSALFIYSDNEKYLNSSQLINS